MAIESVMEAPLGNGEEEVDAQRGTSDTARIVEEVDVERGTSNAAPIDLTSGDGEHMGKCPIFWFLTRNKVKTTRSNRREQYLKQQLGVRQ